MKFVYLVTCLVACLLASGYVFSKNISVLPPPQINDNQKSDFIKWKNDFLKSLIDGEKQSIIDNNQPIYVNELIYSESPYLIQHANNPVNWKPWRPELLQKAKKENKLIFLSIGYSTCHWCHTMEKESFTDIEIASLVNKDYLAIKVDREELPHIDDYYASALEQVKGSAGWPITVIINGDGLPVFIDSYLSKQKLSKLLTRVNEVWKNQPEFLLLNAKTIDSLVRERFNTDFSEQNAIELQKRFEQINIDRKLIDELDLQSGGFKGQVKFPSEAMLLYGLDQLRRYANPELEKSIELQLNKMISGGLYDHIEGGFHRYSTDSTWTIPHFEKMLYNQAQLIEVYSQAYRYFRKPAYLLVVKNCAEFLLESFYIEGKGFASAMDADFEDKEGGYYLWTSEEINKIKNISFIKQNTELLKTYSLNIESTGEQRYGVLLPVAQINENITTIKKIRGKLSDLRRAKGKPDLDNKVLTGWNALAIKAMLSAGELLNNKAYIEIAKQSASIMWIERFNQSSGILSRTGFKGNRVNGEEFAQSYLEDYAYFADALIRLYDATGSSSWLDKSKQINNVIIENFIDDDGGLLNVAKLKAGMSLKKSNDTELVSPAAVVIDVFSKLDRRLGTNRVKRRYSNVIGYMKSKVSSEPLSHLYGYYALNQTQKGSTASKRYFAKANGSLEFRCHKYSANACTQLAIDIKLADGWHINSNTPLQDYLIPTKLEIKDGFVVGYPDKKQVKLGFQKEKLSVYEGQFEIVVKRVGDKRIREFFELPLQACNDTLCLLPEKFQFTM